MSRIYIDEIAVDIRANLHRALVNLRSTTTIRLLWVDALCIDQCNQDEVGDRYRKWEQFIQEPAALLSG
jgi:hypothetical protein